MCNMPTFPSGNGINCNFYAPSYLSPTTQKNTRDIASQFNYTHPQPKNNFSFVGILLHF